MQGMNEAALSLFHGFFYEWKNGIDCVIFFIEDLRLMLEYVFFLLSPVDGEILYSEAFEEVGHWFGDGVDYVCDFIGDDELDVLCDIMLTLAASWSPRKSPSLILIGPSMKSTVVCAFLKSFVLCLISNQ